MGDGINPLQGVECYVLHIGRYHEGPYYERVFLDKDKAVKAIPQGFTPVRDVVFGYYYYGHNEAREKWASIKQHDLE